jgi:hypothetical protein
LVGASCRNCAAWQAEKNSKFFTPLVPAYFSHLRLRFDLFFCLFRALFRAFR